MQEIWGHGVSLRLQGPVAVITIANPPYNHVSSAMMAALADCLAAVDAESQARVTLLTAAGKNFCAGADFTGGGRSAVDDMAQASRLYGEAARIIRLRKPIVAAVQGAAIGAGLGLAMLCDFRIASTEARFAANFVKLSFHPGLGLTYSLPRVVGAQKASLMLLTGRRLKPEEALHWGLVDGLTEPQALFDHGLCIAREIAANGPLGVDATRQTMRIDLLASFDESIATELAAQKLLRMTDDFEEGVRAVAGRRDGNFTGR